MTRRYPVRALLALLLVSLLLLGSCEPESAETISHRYFPSSANK